MYNILIRCLLKSIAAVSV